MNINPSSPQGPRTPADAALEGARTADTRKADSGSQKDAVAADRNQHRADSADVSAEAKALAGLQESRQSASSLGPDRLKEISGRVESGFYDQPKVIDQVASGVANDPDFLGQG